MFLEFGVDDKYNMSNIKFWDCTMETRQLLNVMIFYNNFEKVENARKAIVFLVTTHDMSKGITFITAQSPIQALVMLNFRDRTTIGT